MPEKYLQMFVNLRTDGGREPVSGDHLPSYTPFSLLSVTDIIAQDGK